MEWRGEREGQEFNRKTRENETTQVDGDSGTDMLKRAHECGPNCVTARLSTATCLKCLYCRRRWSGRGFRLLQVLSQLLARCWLCWSRGGEGKYRAGTTSKRVKEGVLASHTPQEAELCARSTAARSTGVGGGRSVARASQLSHRCGCRVFVSGPLYRVQLLVQEEVLRASYGGHWVVRLAHRATCR